jgi:2-keto-4-pentenoate hydratase/2-oxohepta-3-ene-1,7-dioic acid hydratase in catechol pathway
MKLATFLPEPAAAPLAGIVEGDRVRAFAHGGDGVRNVLAGTQDLAADLGTFALAGVQLLAPIPHPGTIFAIGLNYADHIAEMGNTEPEWPTVFVKVNSSVAPPGGPIVCPDVVKRLDYEGELMIAIGTGGKPAAYCVADDVSARDLQKREPQWVRAKGSDTFCPFGPWLTTADEVPDPQNLGIRTWVNGELRQESTTANLVFGITELVSFLSETCTLRPGDLILTGTPGGVGQGMQPPRYLQSGDAIKIEIDQLGSIEHSVA